MKVELGCEVDEKGSEERDGDIANWKSELVKCVLPGLNARRVTNAWLRGFPGPEVVLLLRNPAIGPLSSKRFG